MDHIVKYNRNVGIGGTLDPLRLPSRQQFMLLKGLPIPHMLLFLSAARIHTQPDSGTAFPDRGLCIVVPR